MPRKRKQEVKANNLSSLEGMMQEAYNDACLNIIEATSAINELNVSANPESVDDLTKIAKEKGGLLKVKDSAIRMKLELAKIQLDTIKNNGDADAAIHNATGGQVSDGDLKAVREHLKKTSQENFNND